ncbi:MAG: methylenetetrahydrofolate reductase [Anaerolineales bacterium]
MNAPLSGLTERIASGKSILLAEISPASNADPAPLRDLAKRYAGKVHAVGVSDNRDRVTMSALAAAMLIATEGLEPILHITTRDRNRIALVSEALGAQALGIRNLLCTSGTHQTLGQFRAARNVYDIDAIQLLQVYSGLSNGGGAVVGAAHGFEGAGPFCLAAVASPFADPLEMQVTRLAKKIQAGAKLLVTQPVYDLERFDVWWQAVTRRGLHEQAAFVAGNQPLTDNPLAGAQAGKRRIPEATLNRITTAGDPAAQRAKAIEIAVETIGQLQKLQGLRGFCISSDGDPEAALQIIEKSGLGSN